MNQNVPSGQPGEPAPPLDLLRQARESRGVHIAALSVALKVPVKKLEALEAGRYEELPGLTFARALASSACRQLKLDPAPVLALIPLADSRLGHPDSSMGTPFRASSESSTRQAVWLSRPAMVLGLVLLAGALLLVFWPQDASFNMSSVEPGVADVKPVQPPAPTVVTEAVPATVVEPTTPASPPATGSAATDAAALVPPAGSPPLSALPPATTSATTPAITPSTTAPVPVAEPLKVAPAGPSILSIRATSDSWVEVTNASGAVVLKRLLKSGEVVDFASAPPFSVLLGRADAAEVTVRGQRFDTAPFSRGTVARFEVK